MAWVRGLGLAFGHTVYATSAVAAAFMAGLAIGSYVASKRKAAPASSLRLLAWMYAALALYAAISLPLLALIPQLVLPFAAASTSPPAEMVGYQLAVALIILIPATGVMGATTPVLVGALADAGLPFRRTFGSLYALNTAGAVAGCLGTSFLLMPLWGLRASAHTATCLYAAVALGCGWLSLVIAGDGDRAEPPAAPAMPVAKHPGTSDVPWVLMLCGFCGLSLQTYWTRCLLPLTGVDVQAFSLVLSAVLLGLVFGAAAAARPAMDHVRPRSAFAAAVWLACLTTLASVPILWGLAAWAHGSQITRPTVRCLAVLAAVAPPTVCMGAALPLAAAVLAAGRGGASRASGIAFASNTAGAVAGAVAGGFLVIPHLGVTRAIVATGLLYGCAAAAVAWRDRRGLRAGDPRVWGGALATAAAVAAALWALGQPPPIALKYRLENKRIIHYREGISSTLAVAEDLLDPSSRTLDVDGQVMANTGWDSTFTHKLMGHLPCLLRPGSPKEVLMIGFGSGMTAASVLSHDQTQVTCAEIEPGQRETASFFEDGNQRVLAQRRFTFLVADGRTVLASRANRYDLIIVDRMHPRVCQDLYSKQFMRLCAAANRRGGVTCFTLPTDLCPDVDAIRTVVRTMFSAFPHVSLWYVDSRTSLLVAARSRPVFDWQSVHRALRREAVVRDLPVLAEATPADIWARLVASDASLRAWAGEGDTIDDDRPLCFRWPDRRLAGPEVRHWIRAVLGLRRSWSRALRQTFAQFSAPDLREQVLPRTAAMNAYIVAHQALIEGDYLSAVRICEQYPHDWQLRRVAARAYVALAKLHWSAGRAEAARQAATRAVELHPSAYAAHATLGSIHEAAGRVDQARASYERALSLNSRYRFASQRLRELPPRRAPAEAP